MKISIFASTLLTMLAVADAAQHPKIKLGKDNSRALPSSYIVEFEDSYSGSHTQFLHTISSKFDNADISMRQTYDSPLFKGMSVKIGNSATTKQVQKRGLHHAGSTGVLAAMADSPAVRNVYPVTVIPRPTIKLVSKSHSNSPQLLFAHNLTQVTEAHNYGYKGKGLTVGILDTGKFWGRARLGAP
jgi:hypothetical protein